MKKKFENMMVNFIDNIENAILFVKWNAINLAGIALCFAMIAILLPYAF